MKKVYVLIAFLMLLLFVFDDLSFAASIDANLQHMQTARKLFEKGELDKAYAEYDKVSKDSDYWLESIEEKAHTMGRKGEFNQVISLLKTVTAETFNGVVGPEPYFVLALTHLKICNYSEIFNVTKLFKERFTQRSADLKIISKSDLNNALVQEMLTKANKNKRLDSAIVGAKIKQWPRLFYRDAQIQDLVSQPASQMRDQKFVKRIGALAKRELKEIETIVNKLQIIEADVIQRIYLAEKSKEKREKQGQFEKSKDYIQFPANDEVWLDELDNYAARVEKCPTVNKRAGL